MKKKTFIIALVCTALIGGTTGYFIARSTYSHQGGRNQSSNAFNQEVDQSSGSVVTPNGSIKTDLSSDEEGDGKIDSSLKTGMDGTSSDIGAVSSDESDFTMNSSSDEGSKDWMTSSKTSGDSDKNYVQSDYSSDDTNVEDAEDSSDTGEESSQKMSNGLSTATHRYDPNLILPDGRNAYEYTVPPIDSVIDYYDFSIEDFVNQVATVYQWAHDNHFQYGNSVTLPPCEDGLIACDRLISRALWNLGVTAQPQGGMQIYMERGDGTDEELWLSRHGFIRINDPSLLQRGDIVFQRLYSNDQPTNDWHNFVLTAYDPVSQMCEKYDCGHFTPEGLDRISQIQPFHVPLADFGTARRFVCGFRLRQRPEE